MFSPSLLKSKIYKVSLELFNHGAKAYKTKVQHFQSVKVRVSPPEEASSACVQHEVVHGTQKKNSNPMGIGLGIDYTWWEILKWIPPPSKLHVGTRFNNSWAGVVKTSLLLRCRVLCFVRARCLNSVREQNKTEKLASRRILSKGMNRT